MKNTAKLTRKANTVYAPYLPYAAYKALVQLAKDHNAEIDENADKTLRLTFDEVKTAKNVVAKWTADYANARNAKAPRWDDEKMAEYEDLMDSYTRTKKAPAPAKGKSNLVTVTVDGKKYTVDKANLVPTAPAKKTAPKRAKGNGFDFGKIKGKTNSDKNKALHAVLVGMGMNDSRAKEYQAVWNARPWAN